MKCKDAREIINCLLDDRSHPQRDEAVKHIYECRDCAKWHESLMYAVRSLEMNSDYIEAPDLSSVIMAALPRVHPASSASRSIKWKPIQVFGWTFGSWVIGVAVLFGLWIFMQNYYTGFDINQTASGAYSSIRSMSISFNDISAIPMALVKVVSSLFSSYIGLNVLIIGLAILVVFDTAVAAAVIAIFRRKRMHDTMTV